MDHELREELLARPQLYGTQFMPGQDGFPAPWTAADPEHVNQRRAALGLNPGAAHRRLA
jgi:hypothetical protein